MPKNLFKIGETIFARPPAPYEDSIKVSAKYRFKVILSKYSLLTHTKN